MLIALALGFGMSFVGTMPIAGPIALLVLTRGLEGRRRAGLLLGAGGAAAEAGYAALAWLGVGALMPRFPVLMHVSRAAAAVILIGLGVAFVRRRFEEVPADPPPDRGGGSFALGFAISALNPTFLATWTGAVAAVHAAGAAPGLHVAPVFALGVGAGAVAWFWVLLAVVARYRGRFRPRSLALTLRLFGAGIGALGVWFGVQFVRHLL